MKIKIMAHIYHIVDNMRCSINTGCMYYFYHSVQLYEVNTIIITLPFQMEEWRLNNLLKGT